MLHHRSFLPLLDFRHATLESGDTYMLGLFNLCSIGAHFSLPLKISQMPNLPSSKIPYMNLLSSVIFGLVFLLPTNRPLVRSGDVCSLPSKSQTWSAPDPLYVAIKFVFSGWSTKLNVIIPSSGEIVPILFPDDVSQR